MKTRIAAICGAVAITGLTLTAQTPPPSPTQPITRPQPTTRPDTPAQPGLRKAGETMTVTGCLKTWDEAKAAGRSGAAPGAETSAAQKSVAATKYVLTTDKASFALKAEGTTVDFSKHVNHKVELTGTTDASAHQSPEARSSGTAGSTGTGTPGRGESAMGMAMPTLNVTALKMVSATCS